LYRSLHALDSTITLDWVKQMSRIYDEDELLAARNATTQARPANVRAFFQSRLKTIVPTETVMRPTAQPVRTLSRDPYEV
jgi:hypothetical protein